jgi:hypothetical protein
MQTRRASSVVMNLLQAGSNWFARRNTLTMALGLWANSACQIAAFNMHRGALLHELSREGGAGNAMERKRSDKQPYFDFFKVIRRSTVLSGRV